MNAPAPPPLWVGHPAMERVGAALRAARSVLVTGHADPDGDVAGGCAALFCALNDQGKKVTLYNPDPFPAGYTHLPGARHLVHAVPADHVFDATVVLDAAHWHKVEPFLPPPARRGTALWIDHHPRTAPAGDLEWVDPQAAAMGEMLHELFTHLSIPITPDIGMGLYATLIADTGGFRYESTSVTALRLAATLVELGVKPWDVAEQVYERQPLERVRLLAKVLATLQVSASGRLAAVAMLQQDLLDTGALAAMGDGMINHARGIDGVEMAAQLEEVGPEVWRVTLRSRGTLEAGAVAQQLGERGHRFGAVFVQPGPRPQVFARLAAAVDVTAQGALALRP